MSEKRKLDEGTTEADEIGMRMGFSKKEREQVFGDLGLTPDGE